jgi:hypothetical protein
MNSLQAETSPPFRISGIAGLALLLVLSTLPFTVGADDIPHENYDLANSDLDTVVALLNSSIRSSESALRAFQNESMDEARQYLDRVGAVLLPASQILEDIQTVADSYENLSGLLPPFMGLYDAEEAFYGQEMQLIEARTQIVTASDLVNLSDQQMIAALDAIKTFNALIDQMNATIDEMLVHAHGIDALTVEGANVFVPNDLVMLIEGLRALMDATIEEIATVIEEGIPWGEDISFLLLWLGDTDLYLGEDIVGGGYLFISGAFAVGRDVTIDMDGASLTTARTGTGGRYAISVPIPLNESWLGQHTVQASADTGNGTIVSDEVTIRISLVPTTLTLVADRTSLSIEDVVHVTARLTDVRGDPLAAMDCTLDLDGEERVFVTDAQGGKAWTWSASALGYGTHRLSAAFERVLPYAPTGSSVVTLVVSIPTTLTVRIFQDRLYTNHYILGEGYLYANGTQPLGSQNVSLYIDGVYVQDVVTQEDGKFAFSMPASEYGKGTHLLQAAFDHRDPVWRYSEAEASFTVIVPGYGDYPFFPWIPGWDIGLTEEIPYLFFGEYAYFTWLFIIMVIAIVVKALQVRKARRLQAAEHALPATPTPEEVEEARAEDTGTKPEPAPDWLANSNEKVVWHYNRMVAFLKERRKVGVTDNMTHCEVAKLLMSLGYPPNSTKNVTLLFERAYYSTDSLSEADVIQMGSSAHILKRVGGARFAG